VALVGQEQQELEQQDKEIMEAQAQEVITLLAVAEALALLVLVQ
jgi:hypothetical protein